ncbi:uncharacterized protein LOC122643808 [Telopea speciosissima]|uniref:uncharacterized protein LOC122643808 n=1 Tax=Telopea speciosissima TaxID=54955 RepID=UPI001CC620EF|nr:uncharacterized protein LOC122643808 [Telopea speciosissima]
MATWVSGESRRKRVRVLLFLISFYLMPLIPFSCSAAEMPISRHKLEVQNHLKRLNKPAVKSIKSPDGDIIDCVHASNQPAFDHPSLKNHTIQMRPSFHPEGLFDKNKATTKSEQSSNSITQLWHFSGRCPEGTIPIRRTTKDDILRASSVERFGMKKHTTIPQPHSVNPAAINPGGHEHAIAYVKGDKYYGTKATINLWKPNTQQPNEFSLSQLWVVEDSSSQDVNTIEAGWQVLPYFYGDNNTRLFIYWTSDSYQSTGCYNLVCSGFVQTNNQIALGGSLSPVSAYSGSQYDITILVWKVKTNVSIYLRDPTDGKWWMQLNDSVLGYWPSSLFSYLADSASMIEWGGEVTNTESFGQHTSTQMGSGHFPQEGNGKASYFRNIQVIDGSNNLKAPNGISTLAMYATCYNILSGNNSDWGNYFYYGGPGRNPNCL